MKKTNRNAWIIVGITAVIAWILVGTLVVKIANSFTEDEITYEVQEYIVVDGVSQTAIQAINDLIEIDSQGAIWDLRIIVADDINLDIYSYTNDIEKEFIP